MVANPKRGDVWWVNFDPTRGSEITKTQPCVVLTSDVVNTWRRTVVVVPLSNTKANPPISVVISSQSKTSVAVIDQIRTITKERFGKKLGVASAAEIMAIEDALREILEL